MILLGGDLRKPPLFLKKTTLSILRTVEREWKIVTISSRGRQWNAGLGVPLVALRYPFQARFRMNLSEKRQVSPAVTLIRKVSNAKSGAGRIIPRFAAISSLTLNIVEKPGKRLFPF